MENSQKLQIEILSPKRALLKTEAFSISLPGSLGYMEILPNHAAIISELDMGYMVIKRPNDPRPIYFFVVGGYLEVFNNAVKILANVAETPEEIDRRRVEEAKRRAEERLQKREHGVDLNRAQASLLRALARLNFLDLINSSSQKQ